MTTKRTDAEAAEKFESDWHHSRFAYSKDYTPKSAFLAGAAYARTEIAEDLPEEWKPGIEVFPEIAGRAREIPVEPFVEVPVKRLTEMAEEASERAREHKVNVEIYSEEIKSLRSHLAAEREKVKEELRQVRDTLHDSIHSMKHPEETDWLRGSIELCREAIALLDKMLGER